MSDAKIEIKIGQIEFSGEGQQEWVAEQLDKILGKAEELLAIASVSQSTEQLEHKPMAKDTTNAKMTLPSFLSAKNATKNQVKKFLATAVWLEAKGKSRIQTSEVTKALKDSSQSRLRNLADCLKENIAKGYCEKDGKQFFVTQEGKKSL